MTAAQTEGKTGGRKGDYDGFDLQECEQSFLLSVATLPVLLFSSCWYLQRRIEDVEPEMLDQSGGVDILLLPGGAAKWGGA